MTTRATVIIVTSITIGIFLLIFFSHIIVKPYAVSGGFVGMPKDRICDCTGIHFSYYPAYCADCQTTYHCAGLLRNCMCFNEEKSQESAALNENLYLQDREQFWNDFEKNAYVPCD